MSLICRSPILPFNRTGRNAFDNMLLHGEEENNDRQYTKCECSKGKIPLLHILAKEGIGRKRNRTCFRPANNEQWQQEIIPNPQAVKQNNRDGHRLEKRKDNSPEHAIGGASVYNSRFFNFKWNGLNKAMIQE